jgi:hypothetical protein
LVFPDRDVGGWIWRIFLGKLSIFWQKDIENMGSLREGELLVEVIQGFDKKWDCRLIFWDL